MDTPVKNTFIHFDMGTNENDANLESEVETALRRGNYHKSHSDPTHGDVSVFKQSTSKDQPLSEQSSPHNLLQSGQAQHGQWLSYMTSEAQGSSHTTSEDQSSAQSLSISASGNSFFNDAEAAISEDRDYGSCAPLTQGSSSEAALEFPEGISSIGALGHYTKTCKPCAWNWKPGGCVHRTRCDFCHLCDRGEVKRRRKDRDAFLRKSENDEKRRMAKVGAVDDGRIGATDCSGLDSGPSQQ